jgi:hypothetical protein
MLIHDMHALTGILEKADFFKGKQSRFITACCQLLRPEFYMPVSEGRVPGGVGIALVLLGGGGAWT